MAAVSLAMPSLLLPMLPHYCCCCCCSRTWTFLVPPPKCNPYPSCRRSGARGEWSGVVVEALWVGRLMGAVVEYWDILFLEHSRRICHPSRRRHLEMMNRSATSTNDYLWSSPMLHCCCYLCPCVRTWPLAAPSSTASISSVYSGTKSSPVMINDSDFVTLWLITQPDGSK